jgi:hypothetical protein
MDTYTHIIDEAIRVHIPIVNLNIYGEPLLDKFLFERIVYAKARGMFVQFTSNGTLLTAEHTYNIVKTKVDRIYFSFDGTKTSTYEKIRIGSDFKSTKERLAHFILVKKALGLHTPEIGVVMVVQDFNRKEVLDFTKQWRGVADFVDVWPVDNRRNRKEVLRGLPLPCPKLNELNIQSNGKAVLCCLDYDGEYVIGDTSIQSIPAIRSSRSFQFALNSHYAFHGNRIELCAKCEELYRSGPYWVGTLIPGILHKAASNLYKRLI